MLPTTLEILKSGLKADPTISPAERSRLLAQIRKGRAAGTEMSGSTSKPNILTRKCVAERLHRSVRLVDRLASEGILTKVKLPGRKRAIGFLESHVEALLLNQPGVGQI